MKEKNKDNDEIRNLKIDLERKGFLLKQFFSPKGVQNSYLDSKKKLQKAQIKMIKEKIIQGRGK